MFVLSFASRKKIVQEYDLFGNMFLSSQNIVCPRKLPICFRNNICSFIQEFAKATPTWDELTVFEWPGGKQFYESFTQGGALTNRSWGGRDLGEGQLLKPLSNIIRRGEQQLANL